MKVTDKHVLFYSYQDVFSNHFRCKKPFALPRQEQEGAQFYTGEHFMMYEKAKLFADEDIAQKILKVWHPMEAKKLGRQVRGFKQGLWEEVRENVMQDLVYCRMIYDNVVRKQAIEHRLAGRSFVEASDRDLIWGVGLSENNPLIHDECNWRGLNLLGKSWDKSTDKLMDMYGGYDRVRKQFEIADIIRG